MDLAAAMDEIGDRLETIEGLRVHRWPDERISPPAAVITFPDITYDEAMRRGLDRYSLPVVILCGKVSSRASRDQIAPFLAGEGVKSIKQALETPITPGALDLPNVAGASCSTPDHASLDIVDNLDVRTEFQMMEVTGGNQTLVAKLGGAPNQSYEQRISAFGSNDLVWSANGTALLSGAVLAAQPRALRSTIDVNNGASGRTITHYGADTIEGPWTQIGSPVVQAGTTSIASGSGALILGDRAAGSNRLWGRITRMELRDGIDGTVVADPDFTALPAGTTSFIDDAGRTWTVNGAASIVGPSAAFSAFDSCRVQGAEFDIVTMAGVEYLAATVTIDIAGPGGS